MMNTEKQVFKKEFFSQLNYTLGNEDTELEYSLLKENATHVFSIGGSGSRVVPLLAKHPQKITVNDSSQKQLFFAQLRIETIRECSYGEYLAFWNYGDTDMTVEDRRNVFEKVTLSKEAREYLQNAFEHNSWQSLLYTGRWEKTFIKLSKSIRVLVGKKATTLFEAKTPETYHSYLDKEFPKKRWFYILFLLGNSHIFNIFLYHGNFPKINLKESLYSFYTSAFKKIFANGPVRENFFMQLLVLGRVQYAEGFPFDCNENIFNAAKDALKTTTLEYVSGRAPQTIAEATTPFDFVSFSDVPSYFATPEEQTFMQSIKSNLTSGALVVSRYYLRTPETLDTQGFERVTERYADNIKKEKVQMYSIEVFQKT